MNKKGQESIGMSFSMIFSIFLIIVVIGVALYVIIYFLNLGKCSDVGLFYDGLRGKIEEATKMGTGSYSNDFVGTLPSGIESVCFGNLTQNTASGDTKSNSIKAEILKIKRSSNNNLYLYPLKKACDGDLGSVKLEKVDISSFRCTDVSKGKIRIKLTKNIGENLVKVST